MTLRRRCLYAAPPMRPCTCILCVRGVQMKYGKMGRRENVPIPSRPRRGSGDVVLRASTHTEIARVLTGAELSVGFPRHSHMNVTAVVRLVPKSADTKDSSL